MRAVRHVSTYDFRRMSPEELAAFYAVFHRANPRDAATLVGDTRPGYTRIAQNLASYAASLATSKDLLRRGGLGHESFATVDSLRAAERIRNHLPADVRPPPHPLVHGGGAKVQDAKLTDRELQAAAAKIKRELGLTEFEVYLAPDLTHSDPNQSLIYLAFMTVPKEARGKGVGTEAMRRFVRFADRHGIAMRLYAGNKSTRTRLVRFYQRFGFIEIGPHGEMRREPRVHGGGAKTMVRR